MEEMNPLIQAIGEMLEQKLIVVLDKKLDEVFGRKLDEKLAPIWKELHSINDRLDKMEACLTELEDSMNVVGETVIQMNL